MSPRALISFCRLSLIVALPVALSAQTPAPAEAPAKANEVTIVRVLHEWRDAASFKRIAEYFDGQEHHGGEALRRSHPEVRAGYYFFVRVKNPGALRPAKAALQVISSTAAEPVRYEFPVELRAGDTVFNIGLTGADWPDPKAHPVAWKLQFLADDGHVLASEVSYLWEKPAAK